MKKTLSMLLVVCMLVALVAMPAMAEVEQVKVPVYFDLDSLEVGTVLSSESLADNSVLKYAGIGTMANANVTYTKADGTEATLSNYNPLNFDTATAESDDSWSKVVVTELDGEKVIAMQAKQGVAGIAFQPVGAELAEGKTVQVSFEYNQPKADFMTRNALGLAVDNGEGLDYLEINQPTDPTWDPSNSGLTRFVNNPEVGFLSLTFNQFGVLSPAIFYTRTSTAGKYTGGGAWSMGRAASYTGDRYADTEAGRKDAMGRWYKVIYQMTKATGGIKVRIYVNHVDTDKMEYTEYLYPLSPAELETLDYSKITPVISGQNGTDSEGRMYVRNLQTYTFVEAVAPTYETKTAMNASFEDMEIGTAPRNNNIYVGAGIQGNIVLSAYDSAAINDSNNIKVAYNPATTKGNTSGKVLAVTNAASTTSGYWYGFRTLPIDGAALQQPGGVTFETDYYAPTVFGNGRFLLNQCKDDGASVDGAYSTGDKSGPYYVIGHYQNNRISFADNTGAITWGKDVDSSKTWVRYHVNFQANAEGQITTTWYTTNLTTGAVIDALTSFSAYKNDMTKKYNVVLTLNRFKADGTVYFDNIKVSAPTVNDDYKIYSAEDVNSVYGSSTEFYVELPAAAADSKALANAVTVKDSADNDVAVEVSSALVEGVQTVTIVPVDGLADDEVYTVSFGGLKDCHNKVYGDAKFRAVADWNPYDPENPAVVSTDMNDEVALGDEIAIIVEDGMNGEYTADMYEVTSSNSDVVTVSNETGAWVATVVGAGSAELYVKNLVAPAEARQVIEVSTLGVADTHVVNFYKGETLIDSVTVGDGWLVEAPEVELEDGEMFAMWATDAEGTAEADLTSVKSDMDVYAICSAGYNVTFTTNDETLGTVNTEVIGVAEGFGLPELPGVTAGNDAKFLAWEDAEGNRYTDEELLALTFNSDATFTAIFVSSVAEIGYDYDFTKMTKEELTALAENGVFNAGVLGYNMQLDSEKGLSYGSTASFNFNLPLLNEGVYAVEIDYHIATGSGGANIDMKTSSGKAVQGFFPVGTIHVRQGDGNADGPKAIGGFSVDWNNYNKAQFILDFDNDVFYVINNGIAGITPYGNGLNSEKELRWINFYPFDSGMSFQRFSVKKIDSLNLVTVSATDTETANVMVGNSGLEEATFPAGNKVKIHAQPIEGNFGYEYIFNGWEVEGAEIEDATAPDTYITVTGESATVTATGEVNYVTFKFAENEYVKMVGGQEYAEQTFQWGSKPAGAPEYEVAEGYELQGFAKLYDDGHLGGAVSLETIVGSRADSSSTWVPVVKKIVNFDKSTPNVEGQKGEIIEVPFKTSLDAEVVGGKFVFKYDATALEYVGTDFEEAYETEVYAKKTIDGVVELIIRTDDSITLNGAFATLKFKALATGASDLVLEDYLHLADIGMGYKVSHTHEIGSVTVSALKGDVNVDGKINVYDAIAVLNHVADIAALEGEALAAANVNGDEVVDVTDATQILKYIARIIANF